jgi:hypothetical protein
MAEVNDALRRRGDIREVIQLSGAGLIQRPGKLRIGWKIGHVRRFSLRDGSEAAAFSRLTCPGGIIICKVSKIKIGG